MQRRMDQLWPSIIQTITFDIIGHQIKAITGPTVDATSGLHELIFDGVTAFYWVDKSSSYRKARESADYLPFEGFHYKPDKVHEVILKKNDKPNYSDFDTFPNFILEMWETTLLFIEASAVVIDGQRCEVP